MGEVRREKGKKKSLFRPRKAGFRQTGSGYQENRRTGEQEIAIPKQSLRLPPVTRRSE